MAVQFLLCVLFLSTTLANPPDPPECTGQSICFEEGDRGLVFVFNPWNRNFELVCHSSWEKVDADVACKEAGFPKGALEVSTNLNSHGLNFYMDQVDCNGTEPNLIRCGSSRSVGHCRRGNQAAGAICDSSTEQDFIESERRLESCFADGVSFSLTDEIGNPTIFSTSVQCQGHCAKNPDCVQFSYSSIIKTCRLYTASNKVPSPFEVGGPPNCTSDEALLEKLEEEVCQNGTCLIGGKTEAEGNVFLEGNAVCDDDWGENEARVVCRELGYGGVLRFTTGSMFGQVPAPHTGDKLRCEGAEENLLDCTSSSPPGMQCDSGEGAGVICDHREPAVVAREEVCFNMGVAYQGPPLQESAPQQGVLDAAACQSLCNATPDCTHFTWFFLGRKCDLFSFSNILGGFFVFPTVLLSHLNPPQRRAKT